MYTPEYKTQVHLKNELFPLNQLNSNQANEKLNLITNYRWIFAVLFPLMNFLLFLCQTWNRTSSWRLWILSEGWSCKTRGQSSHQAWEKALPHTPHSAAGAEGGDSALIHFQSSPFALLCPGQLVSFTEYIPRTWKASAFWRLLSLFFSTQVSQTTNYKA